MSLLRSCFKLLLRVTSDRGFLAGTFSIVLFLGGWVMFYRSGGECVSLNPMYLTYHYFLWWSIVFKVVINRNS